MHVRMCVADRVHNADKKTYNNVTMIIYKCTFAAFKTSRVTYTVDQVYLCRMWSHDGHMMVT